MAVGIPSIFTMSGIAPELIVHEKNALVVPFMNSENIYQSILRLIQEKDISKHLQLNGRNDVKIFDLNIMISKLEKLYFQ